MRQPRTFAAWSLFLLLVWGEVSPSAAQQTVAVISGEISGRVVDAESRLPLPSASVILERLRQTGSDEAPAESVQATYSVLSGSEGEYRFAGLPPSTYRVVVARIGYLPATVHVDLQAGTMPGVSVGLEIDPISLAPLEVLSGAPESYGRMRSPSDADAGRLLAERLREARHIVGDTRQLSHADVLEAITLAETDLFRALQRVPGVSTRDDYTATMWTRGASWDQTRVFFDGLPLFNPTHAGWLFSAVNPDAIGSVAFHPGYRSAQFGEGSAAVLDLRSRTGRSGKPLHGNAEVSLASARLALDGELPGAGNWMVAARRSYVDVLSSLVAATTSKEHLHVPYDFSDLSGRVNMPVRAGWQMEVSGILEYDHLRGDIPGILQGNHGRWGNRAARVGFEGPAGPLRARMSVGGTDFSTRIFEKSEAGAPAETTLPALENAIEHRVLSFEIGPGFPGLDGNRWAAGLQVMRDSVSYDGPFSLLGALVSGGVRDSLTQAPFTYGNSLSHSAAWAERRWTVGTRFEGISGLRIEFGDSVFNGGLRRLAPRFAARLILFEGTALNAGWARAYQYTQDVSPAAGPIGPQLHLSAIWVLASSARVFPAVRSDVSTLGLEHSLGDGWGLLFNAYRRDATGLKIPNPAPGPVTIERDPDAEASNRAYGYEMTVRRLIGQWTGSIAYSYGKSELNLRPRDADGEGTRFPASADIRHGLDVTGVYRITPYLRLGGAFTFGSGVPFTRLIITDSPGTERVPPRLGDPNAERTPNYASLDAMLEYSHAFGRWQLGTYLQVRNITNRRNAVTYAGSRECSGRETVGPASHCAGVSGTLDRFEPGLPILPLVGFRLGF